jgi:hypothetical protein
MKLLSAVTSILGCIGGLQDALHALQGLEHKCGEAYYL